MATYRRATARVRGRIRLRTGEADGMESTSPATSATPADAGRARAAHAYRRPRSINRRNRQLCRATGNMECNATALAPMSAFLEDLRALAPAECNAIEPCFTPLV
jgi:hypothetical protein